MTVLVAGATGSIGGEVVTALLDRGARVRALVRTEARFHLRTGHGRALPVTGRQARV
jgi:uncharacterized protein YbjT (DUF2867 family)